MRFSAAELAAELALGLAIGLAAGFAIELGSLPSIAISFCQACSRSAGNESSPAATAMPPFAARLNDRSPLC
jgi:hypothetical protein